MPIVRRAYLAASLAWIAILPLATYAASRAHASAFVHAFAFVAYSIGSLVCHQRPERSFHLWAVRLPVCARCTGIYVGAGLSVMAIPVVQAFRPAAAALKGWTTDDPRVVALVAALPTAGTLVYEWTTADMPSNWMRFAAGLPLGAAVSWLVFRPSPRLRPTGAIH